MRYLLVLPVPFFAIDERQVAIESAFAGHLRLLLASLQPRVQELEVLAPCLPRDRYEASKAGMAVVDAHADRISFQPLHVHGLGRLHYLLQLPRTAWRIWRAVGRAGCVHAGPSELLTPRENLALLFGWLRVRKTVYVVDIDQRNTARMNLATGTWSRGVAWRRRHLHDAWQGLQHHLARMLCSVLLLKGQALVRDFGRGRPHVHYLLDVAHSADMVLTDDRLARKVAAAQQSRQPLRACYFGRLAAYKGIDRSLRAIAAANADGAAVTFDVFGAGEQDTALRALAAELRLDEVVRFHGARAYGAAFFAELEAFDVLLAAPLAEDTPRSATDAQALGMAVLAFDTYYYRELAEQGAGVVTVPWNDVGALAGGLMRLCRDRGLLGDLARRGVAFARANTQEQWLRRRAEWTLGTLTRARPAD
jgi:glycosyltransferase involved in cell wall biosynthesis